MRWLENALAERGVQKDRRDLDAIGDRRKRDVMVLAGRRGTFLEGLALDRRVVLVEPLD
jgi:hypothetical protein